MDVVKALKEKHSTRVGWCIGRGWVLMLGKVFALSHVAGAKLSNPFVCSVARAWRHDEAKQEDIKPNRPKQQPMPTTAARREDKRFDSRENDESLIKNTKVPYLRVDRESLLSPGGDCGRP